MNMATQRVPSFVQDELRPYAMKLHTRDQAKQGQQPAQVPFTKWDTDRAQYVQFLVDSLAVYETLESAVAGHPGLSNLANTGLERSAALKKDIVWMCEYDRTLRVPPCGEAGRTYTSVLRKMLCENMPGFVCHFYNQYFAHTAGGLRIGQNMADKLLGGKKLLFYTYTNPAGSSGVGEGDVKYDGGASKRGSDGSGMNVVDAKVHIDADTISSSSIHAVPSALYKEDANPEQAYMNTLKEELRRRIDLVAEKWTPEQREACCRETINCFKYGGAILAYLNARSCSGKSSIDSSDRDNGDIIADSSGGEKTVATACVGVHVDSQR